jgi:nucleotide-binding universal stress UspA family protein
MRRTGRASRRAAGRTRGRFHDAGTYADGRWGSTGGSRRQPRAQRKEPTTARRYNGSRAPIRRVLRETAITYKTLLVHVDDSERSDSRVEAAARLARTFGARLIGAYLVPTLELTPSVSAMLPDSVVRQRLAESGAAQQRAQERFRAAATGTGLAAIEWRAPAGDTAQAIRAHARGADLAVIGQPDPAAADTAFAGDLANAAILDSGRPVLVIPYIGAQDTIGATVLVALDRSRESARAVADALPLLARAQRVVVVAITASAEETLGDTQARTQTAAYLAGHDIAAEVEHLELPNFGIGEVLLSYAADRGADLVVMGAYGHARFQEFVLGGVTRTMLDAMTVPVLMSH